MNIRIEFVVHGIRMKLRVDIGISFLGVWQKTGQVVRYPLLSHNLEINLGKDRSFGLALNGWFKCIGIKHGDIK